MSIVVWKEIKPGKLKTQAMKKELEKELKIMAREIRQDFNKTVSSWNRKPKFEVITSIEPKGPEVFIGTDDEIYKFVDEGTKPHPIKPKRAKKLRFRSGYRAKTTARVIGSKGGGPFGPMVYSSGVFHPGTEARQFSKTIQKKWQPIFKRRMEKVMKQAAKVSGYSI